jgi:hypothetical protein
MRCSGVTVVLCVAVQMSLAAFDCAWTGAPLNIQAAAKRADDSAIFASDFCNMVDPLVVHDQRQL